MCYNWMQAEAGAEMVKLVEGKVICDLMANQGPRGQPVAVFTPHALGKKTTSVRPGQTPRPP